MRRVRTTVNYWDVLRQEAMAVNSKVLPNMFLEQTK